jgi:superfamily II DNA or RNA helicase
MNESQIRGRNYEIQVYKYLNENYINYEIYEWKNTPFKYIEKYKFIDLSNYNNNNDCKTVKSFMDVGCDILMVNKNDDNDVIIVQCKNYENNKVCVDDLAGFFQLIALSSVPLKGLIISNTLITNQIIFRLKHTNNVKFLNINYEELIKVDENIVEIAREYQLEAVEKFKSINKGILQLFCGMGKTYTSILISENFNNIVILSPLRTYAYQLLNVFSNKLKTHTSNLISSDGVRDLNELLKNKKIKNIYSSTFCSSDIVYELLKHLDNVILIVDEFHNLSFNNITDKNNIIYKILTFNNIDKKLFMSATLKVFEPLGKEDEYIEHSVDNYEDIFGKVFYSYDFKMAVQNKYVNDYQIIIPDTLNEKNKCDFIYFNMLYHGYQKCLVYCKCISDCEILMDEIKNINKKTYNFNIYVKIINYKTSYILRNKILDNFKKDTTKLNFIISMHTMDECIDIPICDSVYITYNVKNSINIIQRISRSLRIYKNKIKSGIFLWCEKYKDLIKINNIISEYNIQFINKVYIKYNEKSDVINQKINEVMKEICNVEDFIKNNDNNNIVKYITDNNNEINEEYYEFYKLCVNNKFGINLDKVMNYLEYKDTKKFHERLKNTYTMNEDFIIIKNLKLENKKAKRVNYYITIDCFEKICFSSKQEKAINIKNFFINMRKTFNNNKT